MCAGVRVIVESVKVVRMKGGGGVMRRKSLPVETGISTGHTVYRPYLECKAFALLFRLGIPHTHPTLGGSDEKALVVVILCDGAYHCKRKTNMC